ncbi:MAG: hypothetical protein IJY86_08610 [Clostridia bacterium]|nr:hypothetical protein [Clostridia bacterium]
MKKRILAAVFTLMMLLSACGEDPLKTASRAAELYGGLESFSATVLVTMDHGDYLTDYVLTHSFSQNTHVLTVSEPLSLSGLTFSANGEDLELSFDGVVFLPPSLDGTGATPVKLLPDMLKALSSGNYEGVFSLTEEDKSLISVSVWSELDGDEFMHRITLDSESLAPVCAQVFCRGKAVLTAEFTEVTLNSSPNE